MFNNKKMSEKLKEEIKELRQEIEEINNEIEKNNRKRINAVTCAECGALIHPKIAKEVKYKEAEELGEYDRVNKHIIKKELYIVNEKYYCDRHEPEYDIVVDGENKQYYKNNVEVDKDGNLK